MLPLSTWKMQIATSLKDTGETISAPAFATAGWYAATVPGTALTTLVNNQVYAEPLYGENMRPERIPESLNKQSYWFRTELSIPAAFVRPPHLAATSPASTTPAAIWVNGHLGRHHSAARSPAATFDISSIAQPGRTAVIAVLVSPQPHPGVPHRAHRRRRRRRERRRSPPSTAPPSSPPSAGTGSPASATATPASGCP